MAKFESEESAFNFAVEYLKQIAETLKVCNYMSLRQDLVGWSNTLSNLHIQLSAKTKEEEDKEFFKDFGEINTMINNPSDRIEKKGEIIFKLRSLEIKLRKRLQQKGMLLPSKEDPRFAVLQR